jgi:hypothetical protein
MDEDEIYIATDKFIRVFDHQANYLYTLDGHAANVNDLVLEGGFLYSVSDDKTVAIWDRVNVYFEKILLEILSPHL